MAVEGRLLAPDAGLGRHASVEDRIRLQLRPVRGRRHRFAARQLDVLRRTAVYDAADSSTFPTQYTNSLPTYADIPTTTLAVYLQDDWRSGQRIDAQSRRALRPSDRVVQRGHSGPAAEDRGQARTRRQLPGRSLGRRAAGDGSRGDCNNFGPRVGIAWDPGNNGVTNIHAAYGMFYDNIRTLTNFGELTWPQAQTIVINNPDFPDPYGGAVA